MAPRAAEEEKGAHSYHPVRAIPAWQASQLLYKHCAKELEKKGHKFTRVRARCEECGARHPPLR